MARRVKMKLFIKINNLTNKLRRVRSTSHKLRIWCTAIKNHGVTATSPTSRKKHIIGTFFNTTITLNVIPIKQRRNTRMQEPRPAQTWNYPFGIAALVFYLTEPLEQRTVDTICYHIRKLTINPVDSTSYFLLLFPEGASVLLFCPQRAICSGFGKGDLSPVLARARQKITETVLELIKEC
jgi:hypothetical protein